MTENNVNIAGEMLEDMLDGAVEVVEVETYATEGNVNHMIETLPLMGKGMMGIFLVTLIIVASVAILNKTTSRKKKDEQ